MGFVLISRGHWEVGSVRGALSTPVLLLGWDPRKCVASTGDESRVLRTDTSDEGGCEVADRIGSNGTRPGGCDNHVLDIQ